MSTNNVSSTSDSAAVGTPQYYQDVYSQQLIEMDEIQKTQGSGAALMFIITTLLPTLNAYTEAMQDQIATTMNTTQEIQNETSNIQNDFNDFQNNPLNQGADVTDAINQAVDILNQVNPPETDGSSNPFASVTATTTSDLNTIFGGTKFYTQNSDGTYEANTSEATVNQITEQWNTAWQLSSSTYNNTTMQPITDAFDSLQNTFSNFSSAQGEQLQYWQGDSNQIESMIEQLQQNMVALYGTIVTSYKSS